MKKLTQEIIQAAKKSGGSVEVGEKSITVTLPNSASAGDFCDLLFKVGGHEADLPYAVPSENVFTFANPDNEKPVEAYGVKGMKSTSWRKTFKSVAALNAWVEKNDAEVHGTREGEVR